MTAVFTFPVESRQPLGKYVPSSDKYLPAVSFFFFLSTVLLVTRVEDDILGKAIKQRGGHGELITA